MTNISYKEIPSVQEILQELGNELPVHQNYIVIIIRDEIAKYRKLAKENNLKYTRSDIKINIVNTVKLHSRSSLRNVINGTGIVLHTNMGRAPLSIGVLQNVSNKLAGYTNLEVDLTSGKRGNRLDHLSKLIGAITNTDGGIIVNNNAAAVLLTLNTFAEGKEVIVSRGQEVEIGGSFRIPDVVEKSNCKLVEVGTTNRTHLKDYEKAINKNTAVLLWVHTSNYVVKGFTKSVTLSELVELGKHKRIPVIADLGSGALVNYSKYGLPNETTVLETVKSGINIATFSGDKLLGGPQSGIIVGLSSALNKIKSNPLYRALRCDKVTIAIMDEILHTYIVDGITQDNLANLLLQTSPKTLHKRAKKLMSQIKPSVIKRLNIEIVDSAVEAGSGSLPEESISSVALELNGKVEYISKLLRTRQNPVIGYINKAKYYIDIRAVLHDQFPELVVAINEL